jgi:hypothetical protein
MCANAAYPPFEKIDTRQIVVANVNVIAPLPPPPNGFAATQAAALVRSVPVASYH